MRLFGKHCREGLPQTRLLLIHSLLAQGEPEVTEFNDFADRSLRPSNPLMVRHYTDSQGKARIQGGKALKASQSYPMKCFGSIRVCSSLFLYAGFNIQIIKTIVAYRAIAGHISTIPQPEPPKMDSLLF